jgi:predicted extracellular nuclease
MYGKGSGNNKFLEITNGAAQSADLYACAVWVVSNGGSWYESSITLSGSLTAGASYRLASSSADSALTSTADLTLSITWNGDDAVGLACDKVLIDTVGEAGDDPGSAFSACGIGTATKDHTLVHKAGIDCMGQH